MELTTLLNRSKDSVIKLTAHEFRMLSFLLGRVNKDKLPTHGYLAWPGTDSIIEFTGLSKPTIERCRKSLVSAGWMQYTPGHGAGSSNHYYINAQKIVDSYVASGWKRPEGLIYTTHVQEKPKKAHKRNTDGLKQNKAKTEQKPIVQDVPNMPVEQLPGLNPDGSPPYWPNGERRYSYDDVMPSANTSRPKNIPNSTCYDDSLECPF